MLCARTPSCFVLAGLLLLLGACTTPSSQAHRHGRPPAQQASEDTPQAAAPAPAQPVLASLTHIPTAPERADEPCGIRIAPGLEQRANAQDEASVQARVLALEGCHELTFHEQPWWSSSSAPHTPRSLRIGLDVQSYAGVEASPAGPRHVYHAWLSLGAAAPANRKAAFVSSLWHVLVYVEHDQSVHLDLTFRDTHLHRELELPLASDGLSRNEPLFLALERNEKGLYGQLGSLRAGSRCEVLRLQAEPVPAPCAAHEALAGLEQRRVPLHARAAAGFTPQAALEVLRQHAPSSLLWGDDGFPLVKGSASTALELRVRPLGFACEAQPSQSQSDEHQTLHFWLPVEVTLKSADGRLDLTLFGGVRTELDPNAPRWNRAVRLEAGSQELHAAVQRGQRPGFALPRRTLSFLSLELEVEASGRPHGALGLHAIEPYPRGPTFPKSGDWAQARCFGEESVAAQRKAKLLFPADAQPTPPTQPR